MPMVEDEAALAIRGSSGYERRARAMEANSRILVAHSERLDQKDHSGLGTVSQGGETMRVGLYARVSTNDKGQTPETQLDALRAYAAARGWEATEYVDYGVSGAKESRPALDAMLSAARKRKIDAVVCVKQDRLARSVRHLVTLSQEFEALGVHLVVLDQAIDTTTPTGRLLFHVLASIAEFERDLIRERVRAGMTRARREGKHLGRPRKVNGECEQVSPRVENGEMSQRAAARVLGVSRSTVSRLMSRHDGEPESHRYESGRNLKLPK